MTIFYLVYILSENTYSLVGLDLLSDHDVEKKNLFSFDVLE